MLLEVALASAVMSQSESGIRVAAEQAQTTALDGERKTVTAPFAGRARTQVSGILASYP